MDDGDDFDEQAAALDAFNDEDPDFVWETTEADLRLGLPRIGETVVVNGIVVHAFGVGGGTPFFVLGAS